MLYNLQNNILTIKNLLDGKTFQFDLQKFNFPKEPTLFAAACGRQRNAVAISFYVCDREGIKIVKTYAEGILLCDLLKNDIRILYHHSCHDILFDKNDSQKLYINTIGKIASLNLTDGSVHMIYKFRNFVDAPIGMKQSDSGKSLLFTRYKSDNKMLHLLDLENDALKCVIGSVFHYDFLSDDRVVHSLSRGLKIYHVNEKKNTIPLKDASVLSKRYGNHPFAIRISEFLSASKGIIDKELSAPHVFCGRIYFKVLLLSELGALHQWCSVNKDFLDFQTHCDESSERLCIHGDASRHIFLFQKLFPEDKQWSCRVYDGGRQYKFLGYAPVILN